MKLYFNPRSRATIAKWMLDECDAPYELVHIDLEKREHKSPDFLQINPAGKLPALVDGETRLFENAAICLYLADRFASAKLAPLPDAPERGRYLSLMVYSTSQLDPSMGDAMMNLPTAPMRGWTDYPTVLDVLERELGKGPYLFGDWFTAADIMIGSMLIWKQAFTQQPVERPVLEAYTQRLMARPKGLRFGA